MNLSKQLRTIGLFTVVVLFTAFKADAAPQTYALKCRGGGNLSFLLNIAGKFRFGFVKAPVAAGPSGSNLKAGECAWVDRAIGAAEPGAVEITTGPNFKIGVMAPHQLNNSFRAYMYAENQPWVYNFQTKDTILTIYVFNDGSGNFVAPNP